MIKSSFYEANENITLNISQIKLLSDIFDLDLIDQENKESDENFIDDYSEKYNKIFDELNLNTTICISHSFVNFLRSFMDFLKKISVDLNINYLRESRENLNRSYTLSIIKSKIEKGFSFLYNLYDLYYNEKVNEKDFAEILILHNNIKAFIFAVNFYLKIDFIPKIYKNMNDGDNEKDINELILSDEANNLIEYIHFYIYKFKDFSELIIGKIFSDFFQNLSEEFSTVENFDELRYDRKCKKAEKMFKNCNEYIIKFFDYFKLFANENDFFFNLNYCLCMFFDVLNKKIISIKEFSVDDLVALSNFLKTNSTELKNGLENIIDKNLNTQFKLKYSKILDINQKYKKFEEIIFILNSSLKDIKNLVVNSNKKLNIDQNELIALIDAIFEESDIKEEVKNTVCQYMKK